jgi:hypothetical protein
VLRILTQNKRNFLAFLDEFERDSEDETLCAHKAEMTSALQELPDSVPPLQKKLSSSASAATTPTADAALQQQQQQQQQQYQQQHPPLPQHHLPLSPSEALP